MVRSRTVRYMMVKSRVVMCGMHMVRNRTVSFRMAS